MGMKRAVGWLCLAGFIACIFLANLWISHGLPFGLSHPPAFPGGPWTIGTGKLAAPAGVAAVGLSFGLRDFAQMGLRPKRWPIFAAIVIGAGLSYLVADKSIAVASFVGFLVSETADFLAYTPLADRGKLVRAIVLSNTVGSALDTILFLWIAFGSLSFFWGQMFWKCVMILPAIAIIVPLRVRRAAMA